MEFLRVQDLRSSIPGLMIELTGQGLGGIAMKRLSFLGLLVALYVAGAGAQAGLLSQQTTITDPLGPYTNYAFGSTGVVIDDNGLEFVAGSPNIVFPPAFNDGTGAGYLFQFMNPN